MDTGTSEDPPLEGDWFELHIPGGEKITFHADHVQRHSMILGWMMSESPREAWARGLAAAFDGRAPAHIKLFMALASTEDAILQVECKKLLELSSIASWDVLEGVVRLADLLNAPAIMEVC